jgi:transcriptional regulator with XRE-family HTH domain
MNDIREVLAVNLKKFRQARGWSQAKLAEKVKTSTQYIGMIEIQSKFPSSEMIHRLAAALSIDPTELFYREIDPEAALIDSKRAALEDIGEAAGEFFAAYIARKLKELEAPKVEEE